jgi:transcriptional regulator of acetoin/glycerol metabolism
MKTARNIPARKPAFEYERAWDRLHSEQYIDQNLLRNEIALSWKRCLQNKVDRLSSKNSLDESCFLDKLDNNKKLLHISKPHIHNLYNTLKGMGVVVILTDAGGTILDIFGDKKMFNVAESVSLIPGASCTEDVIGTTSPGVCLVLKQPFQVSLLEHYCQLYHNWNCSASPIFDNHGNLLGTLDVSYTDKKLHTPMMLGLVDTTAKAIEMELNFRTIHNDLEKSYHYFEVILDNLHEPLLFIDSHGTLTHINEAASKLICTSPHHLVGEQFGNIVTNYNTVKYQMANNRCWSELNLMTPRGIVQVDAQFHTINDCYSGKIGTIGTLKESNKIITGDISAKYSFNDYIHRSKSIDSLITSAKNISCNEITVLIQGESGTGKEILSQAIHNNSPRRKGPFIVVNCAALPKELIQSELFGYEEGTFTGAKKGGKAGKFELANGGTIFLDEIGDMPFDAQANLLRVLQEKCVTRVGGSRPIALDVRVIAATNRDLMNDIGVGKFRHDLYYRLSVVTLLIPPLRDRKEDLEILLHHFIKKHVFLFKNFDDVKISSQVMNIFMAYDWPGNIRELENTTISFLNSMKGTLVTTHDIPSKFGHKKETSENTARTLEDIEREAIIETLGKCNNNISLASSNLGITRATLYRKIRKYNVPGYEI